MDGEPTSSSPPPLPQPPSDEPWLVRLALWRERAADVAGANAVRVIAVAGVLAALGVGFLWAGEARRGPPVETLLPTVDPAAVTALGETAAAEPALTTIVVHVAGAVARPGLVELTPPARVADAVAAAGGATIEGDLDRLNLATLLSDEDRVVVPVEGEEAPQLANGAGDAAAADVSGPLDLNSASSDQLEALPGVGPATAAAIIAYRTENGPFQSVTALDNVAGIGPAKLAQLRDLVSVEP